MTVLAAARRPRRRCSRGCEELNFRVVHVYGLTETYGPITVSPEPGWIRGAGRGRPRARARPAGPGVPDRRPRARRRRGRRRRAARRRDDGRGRDAGQQRDARLPRRSEATAHAFRGGWFHSGDLAVWHPDGTIELRDRAKDVIISGGENISTIEVEQALASHPAVLECAVVAIPHERWGERPKAFVTLREGAEATRRGVDRALPRRSSRTSRPRMPSSSARCRRRRPARSRSSSCAIASGATA